MFYIKLSFGQGCSAKKEVWERTQKLVIFSSTSSTFLNQYLMKYSPSLHYKRKHEKSMGMLFPRIRAPHYTPDFGYIYKYCFYYHAVLQLHPE